MNRTVTLLLFLFTTAFLASEPLMWEENGLPLYTISYIRYEGSSAQNDAGETITMWADTVGGYCDIFAMRFDPDGNNMWDEPRNICHHATTPWYPSIFSTADGNLMIVWCDMYDYYYNNLYLQKVDWDGNPIWESPLIATDSYMAKYPEFSCFPDAEGGAYLMWQSPEGWESYNCAINHITSDGDMDWEDGYRHLFGNWNCFNHPVPVCADGEGGIIVANIVDLEDKYPCYCVQRFTAEGETPWGDEGFLIYEETSYGALTHLFQSGENEYSVLYSFADSTGSWLQIKRLNLDGETLSENSTQIEEDISQYESQETLMDHDGNIFISWAVSKDYIPYNYILKITPDNEFSVFGNSMFETEPQVGYIREIELACDTDGNLYNLWTFDDYDFMNLHIQKYDTEGRAQWDQTQQVVLEGAMDISDVALNVAEDHAIINWADNRSNYLSVYKQCLTSSGDHIFVEGGELIHEGWCSNNQTSAFTDMNHRVDRLSVAWSNLFDSSCYLQTIDMDGETGAGANGTKILSNPRYKYRIQSIIDFENDVIVVWTQEFDDHISIRANRFDANANRVWDSDLIIAEYSPDDDWTINNIQVSQYLSNVLVAWQEFNNPLDRIRVQRIANGELAWDEPMIINEDSASNYLLMHMEDDYIVWLSNYYRVIRITMDGGIYENWEEDGTVITTLPYSQNFWDYTNTEDGLVITWKMQHDDDTIRLQLVHQDGTKEWVNSLAIASDSYIQSPASIVIDKNLYVFWTHESLNINAFTIHGETLWDSVHVYNECPGSVSDVSKTPDGILLSGAGTSGGWNNNNIWLQHMNLDGTFTDDPIIVCDAVGSQHTPRLIDAENNKYFIMWKDYRTNTPYYEYYVQLFDYEQTKTEQDQDAPGLSPNLTNYPNPFNPTTTVQFSLAKESEVELKVYNVKGQLVKTLQKDILPSGRHFLEWNGEDNRSRSVSSGVYLMNLNIDGRDYRRKILLLK